MFSYKLNKKQLTINSQTFIMLQKLPQLDLIILINSQQNILLIQINRIPNTSTWIALLLNLIDLQDLQPAILIPRNFILHHLPIIPNSKQSISFLSLLTQPLPKRNTPNR